MTFAVDLKCLSIIGWSVILPYVVPFLLVCFILGPCFALKSLPVLLLKGPSFTLSVIFLFGPEWTELPCFDVFGSFPVVADASSLAVLLPVADVHISVRSHSSGLLPCLFVGVLETVHPWTWNVARS